MRKIIIAVIIAAFVIALGGSIIYGQENKKSYKNDVEFTNYLENEKLKVMYYHYPFNEKYDIYGNGDEVHSYSDLEDRSEVVVKVQLNREFKRKIYYECVLSEVEIKASYKGGLNVGEKLNIFEPINCTGIKGTLLCSEGYSPMEQGKEYLLYLKPVKNSLYGEKEVIYVPSTLTYSKFSLDDRQVKRFTERELEYGLNKYADTKDQDVYLYDKKMYELFIRLKSEALKNWNMN